MITVLAIIGIIVISNSNKVTIENNLPQAQNSTTTPPSVETEEYPEEWLKEAEDARLAVLERLEKEARIAEIDASLNALSAEKEQLEKEIGVY